MEHAPVEGVWPIWGGGQVHVHITELRWVNFGKYQKSGSCYFSGYLLVSLVLLHSTLGVSCLGVEGAEVKLAVGVATGCCCVCICVTTCCSRWYCMSPCWSCVVSCFACVGCVEWAVCVWVVVGKNIEDTSCCRYLLLLLQYSSIKRSYTLLGFKCQSQYFYLYYNRTGLPSFQHERGTQRQHNINTANYLSFNKCCGASTTNPPMHDDIHFMAVDYLVKLCHSKYRMSWKH